MKKAGLIVIIILALALAGYFFLPISRPLERSVKVGSAEVKIKLADTPRKRAKGLSGQPELKENRGLLFVYKAPGRYSFWMKEMYFPIDIIWIGENYQIVGISKNISPDSYPRTFQPPEPVKYVLEVRAGFSDKNNLLVGQMIGL